MCDLSKLHELRERAEAGEPVTLEPAVFLGVLDALESVPVQLVTKKEKREPKAGTEKDEECARWMFDVLKELNPTAKAPNFAAWARDVRLMRECDNRTLKEIGGLFRWAQKDDFWCANILSPAKLRKQWDTLVMQRRRAELSSQPAEPKQLGKQGQATAQNAMRWLEEHGNAA
jgi:hypothetical protein